MFQYRTLSYHLSSANNMKEPEKVIEALRLIPIARNQLKFILSLVFDPYIKWALPEGTPPYTASPFFEEGFIYKEMRKFYRFDPVADPKLPDKAREKLFIQMLEYLHPDDAKLLIAIKDKKLPYEYITAEVVKAVFPEINMIEPVLPSTVDTSA